jgi:general secretion pathway protein K
MMSLKSKKGVIIIACLWICALVLWLSLNAALLFRYRFADSATSALRVIGFYAAVGGIYETIARMPAANPELSLTAKTDELWKPDGTIHTVKYDRCSVLVRAEDELNKVNINVVSQDDLVKILRENLKIDSASMLADRILDFIDPDDYVRDQGAEKDFYEKAKLGYLPYNKPLAAIENVLLVPGMSWEIFWGRKDNKASFLPSTTSFFSFFTVYGSKKSLDTKAEETETKKTEEQIWKPGGLYRIVAGSDCGGNRRVVVYAVVKYNPGQDPYYQIQYIKELL